MVSLKGIFSDKIGVKKRRYLVPISLKLSILMLGLLTIAVSQVITFFTDYFEETTASRENIHLREKVDISAKGVDALFWNYINVLQTLNKSVAGETKDTKVKRLSKYGDLLLAEVWSQSKSKYIRKEQIRTSSAPKRFRGIDKTQLAHKFVGARSFSGEIIVRNVSSKSRPLTFLLSVPIFKNRAGNVMEVGVGYFSMGRLLRLFGKSKIDNSFLLDENLNLISHSNFKLFRSKKVLRNAGRGITQGKKTWANQGFFRYQQDLTGETFLAAYSKTSQGLVVVVETPEKTISIPVKKARIHAQYISFTALGIAVLLVFIFSISITSPVEELLKITKEVANGNLHVKAHLRVRSNDEIGFLADAFDDMTKGLLERRKMMNIFDQFHGSETASKLLSDKVRRQVERKNVTIMFADIRGFTEMSEQNSPEEVVAMLNEYFEAMVTVINRNHGVVDKFIGDAIMAVWGIGDIDYSNPAYAVKTCLEMRVALNEFNKKRVAEGKIPIKIGIGLNYGSVVSGIVGSEKRMEFTSIGDAVNVASRIEETTKKMGTDFLISKPISEMISHQFMTQEVCEIKAQGKEETIKVFKVTGYWDEDGNSIHIESDFSIPEEVTLSKIKIVS